MIRKIQTLIERKTRGGKTESQNVDIAQLAELGLSLDDESVLSLTVVGDVEDAERWYTERMEKLVGYKFRPETMRPVHDRENKVFGMTITKVAPMDNQEMDAIDQAYFA